MSAGPVLPFAEWVEAVLGRLYALWLVDRRAVSMADVAGGRGSAGPEPDLVALHDALDELAAIGCAEWQDRDIALTDTGRSAGRESLGADRAALASIALAPEDTALARAVSTLSEVRRPTGTRIRSVTTDELLAYVGDGVGTERVAVDECLERLAWASIIHVDECPDGRRSVRGSYFGSVLAGIADAAEAGTMLRRLRQVPAPDRVVFAGAAAGSAETSYGLSLAALANTPGTGRRYLAIGVDEEGRATGALPLPMPDSAGASVDPVVETRVSSLALGDSTVQVIEVIRRPASLPHRLVGASIETGVPVWLDGSIRMAPPAVVATMTLEAEAGRLDEIGCRDR